MIHVSVSLNENYVANLLVAGKVRDTASARSIILIAPSTEKIPLNASTVSRELLRASQPRSSTLTGEISEEEGSRMVTQGRNERKT